MVSTLKMIGYTNCCKLLTYTTLTKDIHRGSLIWTCNICKIWKEENEKRKAGHIC